MYRCPPLAVLEAVENEYQDFAEEMLMHYCQAVAGGRLPHVFAARSTLYSTSSAHWVLLEAVDSGAPLINIGDDVVRRYPELKAACDQELNSEGCVGPPSASSARNWP